MVVPTAIASYENPGSQGLHAIGVCNLLAFSRLLYLVSHSPRCHSLLHTRRGARSLPGAARLAHNSCGDYRAVDIDDAIPGLARTVRASQENRSLDTPSLVIRLCYWRYRLLDAVSPARTGCRALGMCNKTELAVGLSISLTGKFRPQDQQALQGIRLWQSYINAQGGIAVRNGENRSVRLIWYDDRSQISFARKNVFQLLKEDQINILLGPYSSSLTMAVAEIAEEHKKVVWNYGGSSDDIFSHGRRRLVGIASPASVPICESFRTGWRKSTPHSVEFVSCIQVAEPLDGRLFVGSWNRSLLWPASRSSLSQSTLPSKTTKPFFGRCSTSIRRLLF